MTCPADTMVAAAADALVSSRAMVVLSELRWQRHRRTLTHLFLLGAASVVVACPLLFGGVNGAHRCFVDAVNSRTLGVYMHRAARDSSSSSLRGDVAMRALVKKTKRIKKANNIAHLKGIEHRAFSNNRLKKRLQRVKKVAEEDSWTDEFLSYQNPHPVGGEYVMSASEAQSILWSIYGEGSTLERIKLAEEEAVSRPNPNISPDDLDDLERIRRKRDPGFAPSTAQDIDLRGHIPGIMKGIGTMPKTLRTGPGTLGVKGGSKGSDGMQEVWISGNSIKYDFEGRGS